MFLSVICKLWLGLCRGQFSASRLTRAQHILNEYTVSFGWICDHYVRDRADELAVLNDGAAGHECVQVGTTNFHKKFIFAIIKCSFAENNMYLCSKFSI